MCGHGITYLQRKEAKVIYIFVPELKTDVHAVGPLVAGQLDKAFLVLEGHRHREVVDGTTSHDPADDWIRTADLWCLEATALPTELQPQPRMFLLDPVCNIFCRINTDELVAPPTPFVYFSGCKT